MSSPWSCRRGEHAWRMRAGAAFPGRAEGRAYLLQSHWLQLRHVAPLISSKMGSFRLGAGRRLGEWLASLRNSPQGLHRTLQEAGSFPTLGKIQSREGARPRPPPPPPPPLPPLGIQEKGIFGKEGVIKNVFKCNVLT